MASATLSRQAAAQTSQSETDTRLNILNTLLTTPHRDLAGARTVHEQMLSQDPLFYVRLAAWYNDTGEIRDHKEMFIISLCVSNFPGHRDVGLAMLRELPPYQVARVVNFIKGGDVPQYAKTVNGKRKTTVKTMAKQGLFRNVPDSVKTEVKNYLRDREGDAEWFDSAVLMARDDVKRMYAVLHLKPGDRAQKILFEREMPKDSRLAALKALRATETPAEQARIIVENRIPYRVAQNVVSAITPTVLLAFVQVMSDQELINNLGSLKRRGAFNNAELKLAINQRLGKATTGKRVAAMKTSTAKKAVEGLDAETVQKLDAVGDAQIKARGRIKRSTMIHIDKSGSMSQAIALGTRISAMLSAIMDAPLYVYACDTMAYPITAKGAELSDWEKAMVGIHGTGGTSCGVGIDMMIRNNQRVEQIIMVSDEGEQNSPSMLAALRRYQAANGTMPHVVFVRCGTWTDKLEKQLKDAGIEHDAYTFNGDYYSLPGLVQYLTRPSKTDLLMDIMSYELPVRKTAAA